MISIVRMIREGEDDDDSGGGNDNDDSGSGDDNDDDKGG